MVRTHRTPKGTILPLLNLRGRDYLEVKFRLVWFREECANWTIETELLQVTVDSAYCRAVIKDDSGRIIATSHKFETKKGFPDFLEKAETGAIGRALALCGYGTQFCADELDEGDRVVDSPVETRRVNYPSTNGVQTAAHEMPDAHFETPLDNPDDMKPPENPGDYLITFGKKLKGKRLKDVPRQELEGYIDWLEASAAKQNLPLSDEARFLKVAVGRYLYHNKQGA